MIFEKLRLEGAYVIRLQQHGDERGFFARAWCQREFETHGLTAKIVQANTAYSRRKGTLRGMHYQVSPYAEAKLLRCIRGAVYDVMIDLRPDSSTFKSWYGIELDDQSYKMVYVPEGFAHGYMTLADQTEVFYQVSEFYASDAERGIRWNDPVFNVQWPGMEKMIISEKDRNWPDYDVHEIRMNPGEL